ncbi:HAD family hydrolase [Streptoalloteichus hindustanus]|uniref:Phosphoglycolate phosphatase, HAD superfamily n=1 Tax=Streptoalloteichus hindustanus TaxID=2017 RepID=A0A1M5B9Z2_STRHI|nr:HAD hydrolase-like protein [Streptoalloteichus hindustanus]SHF39268.1 Phosphoglycolate phosphatase, HAD superfamily [Streptoalloteichus hindustanus]
MTGWGLARGARHVVWDWNGTLLDDNHAVLEGVNAVCRSYGREPLTLDQWREMFSRPLLACYERVLDRSLTLEEWADLDRRYHDTYRGLLSTCGLAAGVPDHLHAWSAAGGTQSLLSMWFHDELVPLITEMGLAELFARVDGLRVDVGGGSKAEHLVEHLDALRLDPADVVLIGDVADDAHAAQQAGASCVLVSTGMMSRSALEATGAPVADSVAEAMALVQGARAA